MAMKKKPTKGKKMRQKVKKQKATRRPNGTFAPGVVQPGAKPWRPGQSGNPAGQRPGPSLITRLKQILAEPLGPGEADTRGDRLMELAVKAAEAGAVLEEALPGEDWTVEIFQEPQGGVVYCAYSDVGEGLKNIDDEPVIVDGARLDTTYSTCIVRRTDTWELCAIMECRYPVDVFAVTVQKLLALYGNPLWGIELPGAGATLVGMVKETYPGKLYQKLKVSPNTGKASLEPEIGFRLTAQSKDTIEGGWARFVRERPDLLGSPRIADQALTYIRDPRTGKNRPKSSCFSDILLADMGCIMLLAKGSPGHLAATVPPPPEPVGYTSKYLSLDGDHFCYRFSDGHEEIRPRQYLTPEDEKQKRMKRIIAANQEKWEERRKAYSGPLGKRLAKKMRM